MQAGGPGWTDYEPDRVGQQGFTAEAGQIGGGAGSGTQDEGIHAHRHAHDREVRVRRL